MEISMRHSLTCWHVAFSCLFQVFSKAFSNTMSLQAKFKLHTRKSQGRKGNHHSWSPQIVQKAKKKTKTTETCCLKYWHQLCNLRIETLKHTCTQIQHGSKSLLKMCTGGKELQNKRHHISLKSSSILVLLIKRGIKQLFLSEVWADGFLLVQSEIQLLPRHNSLTL